MTPPDDARIHPGRALLLASTLMATLGLAWAGSATAAEPKPAPAAKPVDDAAKAKQAAAALREIRTALDADAKAKPGAKSKEAPTVDRPAKVVSDPGLDAAGVDALLDKALAASKVPNTPATTDEEFVRRAYLDVAGKLPTIDEMRAFVGSRDKGKRARLIDGLLATDAFATNWARFWWDVIEYRALNENANQINGVGFETWLAGELHKNRPWDEIATAIITAEGDHTTNGAAAFGFAQSGQAVEMAGEVSRVFMGVQIQCAQCHDHPSDPWKREQFHQFASFFAGLAVQRSKASPEKGPATFTLASRPNVPRYTMPDLKEPTKSIAVEPKFFLGDSSPSLPGLKSDRRRALAASYVTGQDNPWFARAFVNRTWAALMGEGFYNPVDDLGPTKEPKDAEVLEALATAWSRGGYDVKWLFRTILSTRAYARQSRATNTQAGRTPFAASCPTRLRGDQILDALAQALDLPPEAILGRGGRGPRAVQVAANLAKKGTAKDKPVEPINPAQAVAAQKNSPRSAFNKTFGVDPSTPVDDVIGTIPQALFLMNSPAINNGLKATKTSMLGDLLRSTPDNRAVLNVLYLRVLARSPNPREVHVCGKYLEMVPDRAEAFEDILWGLINSTEFIIRR